MEQHVRTGARPFLGDLFRLVVRQAADAGAHDHGRGRDLGGPAGVVAGAGDEVHVAVAELFGGVAHAR